MLKSTTIVILMALSFVVMFFSGILMMLVAAIFGAWAHFWAGFLIFALGCGGVSVATAAYLNIEQKVEERQSVQRR